VAETSFTLDGDVVVRLLAATVLGRVRSFDSAARSQGAARSRPA
jgi:hypothetical protein